MEVNQLVVKELGQALFKDLGGIGNPHARIVAALLKKIDSLEKELSIERDVSAKACKTLYKISDLLKDRE